MLVRSKLARVIVFAGICGTVPTPAAKAAPAVPDGTYRCILAGQTIGLIRLAAGQYFGPTTDGNFGAAKRFITMDPDRIEWLGNMGSITQDGTRIDKTEIRSADGRTVFNLTLLPPNGSSFVTAICSPI